MKSDHPPLWKRLAMGIAQAIIMEGNKIVLALILCIATLGMAYAGVGQMWNESMHLIHIVRYAAEHSFEDVAAEFVIDVASVIDLILLLSAGTLVIQGSFLQHITNTTKNLLTGKDRTLPPALIGLTSGKLKEKTISTITMASAVYLFKVILSYGSHQDLSWEYIVMLGGFHALFILGLWVLAKANLFHSKDSHA
jgi:uncharacterized membrane protein YqhA